MERNQNPVHTKGDRNVFCRYYRNCLDHAVELQWEYWACFDCRHQKEESFTAGLLHFPVDTDPYHSFPGFFQKKAANTAL